MNIICCIKSWSSCYVTINCNGKVQRNVRVFTWNIIKLTERSGEFQQQTINTKRRTNRVTSKGRRAQNIDKVRPTTKYVNAENTTIYQYNSTHNYHISILLLQSNYFSS